jgi:glycine betaine/proline transport system permease protein
VIFSPPAVRLTSLGIRNVAEDVIEAGRFGKLQRQILFKIIAFGKINYFGRN